MKTFYMYLIIVLMFASSLCAMENQQDNSASDTSSCCKDVLMSLSILGGAFAGCVGGVLIVAPYALNASEVTANLGMFGGSFGGGLVGFALGTGGAYTIKKIYEAACCRRNVPSSSNSVSRV